MCTCTAWQPVCLVALQLHLSLPAGYRAKLFLLKHVGFQLVSRLDVALEGLSLRFELDRPVDLVAPQPGAAAGVLAIKCDCLAPMPRRQVTLWAGPVSGLAGASAKCSPCTCRGRKALQQLLCDLRCCAAVPDCSPDVPISCRHFNTNQLCSPGGYGIL